MKADIRTYDYISLFQLVRLISELYQLVSASKADIRTYICFSLFQLVVYQFAADDQNLYQLVSASKADIRTDISYISCFS